MRRMQIVIRISLLSIILVAGGCLQAPRPIPTSPAVAPTPVAAYLTPYMPVKQAWEEEWAGALAQSRREGKVIVNSIGTATREALIKEAKERFGISVEWVTASGGTIFVKLSQERLAGVYTTDVYIGGGPTLANLFKRAGMLDPLKPVLILPEVIDLSMWESEWGSPWYDREQKYIWQMLRLVGGHIIINTDLVKPGEIKSLPDILDHKWKGKILLTDPTVSGIGDSWVRRTGWGTMSEDFLRQLAKQDLIILRDQRLIIEWLVRGKYAIGLGLSGGEVQRFIDLGAPIKQIAPEVGGHITGGSSQLVIMNRAPHPNAAKVFINWLLTMEGQTIYSKALLTPSLRRDVPTEGLDPAIIPVHGRKYYPDTSEEQVEKIYSPEISAKIMEIFGPLIRG